MIATRNDAYAIKVLLIRLIIIYEDYNETPSFLNRQGFSINNGVRTT
jgi:hypothetical protein